MIGRKHKALRVGNNYLHQWCPNFLYGRAFIYIGISCGAHLLVIYYAQLALAIKTTLQNKLILMVESRN
jgi:hypothetical protein